jgi:hypothetical protein
MSRPWDRGLDSLRGTTIAVRGDDIPDLDGQASIIVEFSDGTRLKACYWRALKNGKSHLSSFDHHQKYGLPAAIDAKNQLADLLTGSVCQEVVCDRATADLLAKFDQDKALQVFNFTGYEIWEIQFPDGTGQYSNYALSDIFGSDHG